MEQAPKGFHSWRALFEHVKNVGMADEQRVELEYNTDENSDTVAKDETHVKPGNPVLYVDEIKARAFDEIYDLLPEPASVSIMKEMLETASKIGVNRHVRPVIEFLNKIPTCS